MRANRDLLSVLFVVAIASGAQAQVQAPVANMAAGSVQPTAQVQGTPSVAPAPASAASGPALARPSDTIGEAADRQRMARMLQSQAKPSGAAVGPAMQQQPGGGPIVGGISVERAPMGITGASKYQQPEMALVEILRGPKATVVAIEVSGVERRVAEGDDLGNGWRVKKVGRFTVDLEEFTGVIEEIETPAKGKAKGKAKTTPVKKALKTQSLALKSAQAGGSDMQRTPVTR